MYKHNDRRILKKRRKRVVPTHYLKFQNLHMMDVLLKINWMTADAVHVVLVETWQPEASTPAITLRRLPRVHAQAILMACEHNFSAYMSQFLLS